MLHSLSICILLAAVPAPAGAQAQGEPASADARLKALYTEEWNWRQREGGRQELYEVLFRNAEGKPARYKAPDEPAWRRFEEGRTYRGKVKSDGTVVEIEGAP